MDTKKINNEMLTEEQIMEKYYPLSKQNERIDNIFNQMVSFENNDSGSMRMRERKNQLRGAIGGSMLHYVNVSFDDDADPFDQANLDEETINRVISEMKREKNETEEAFAARKEALRNRLMEENANYISGLQLKQSKKIVNYYRKSEKLRNAEKKYEDLNKNYKWYHFFTSKRSQRKDAKKKMYGIRKSQKKRLRGFQEGSSAMVNDFLDFAGKEIKNYDVNSADVDGNTKFNSYVQYFDDTVTKRLKNGKTENSLEFDKLYNPKVQKGTENIGINSIDTELGSLEGLSKDLSSLLEGHIKDPELVEAMLVNYGSKTERFWENEENVPTTLAVFKEIRQQKLIKYIARVPEYARMLLIAMTADLLRRRIDINTDIEVNDRLFGNLDGIARMASMTVSSYPGGVNAILNQGREALKQERENNAKAIIAKLNKEKYPDITWDLKAVQKYFMVNDYHPDGDIKSIEQDMDMLSAVIRRRKETARVYCDDLAHGVKEVGDKLFECFVNSDIFAEGFDADLSVERTELIMGVEKSQESKSEKKNDENDDNLISGKKDFGKIDKASPIWKTASQMQSIREYSDKNREVTIKLEKSTFARSVSSLINQYIMSKHEDATKLDPNKLSEERDFVKLAYYYSTLMGAAKDTISDKLKGLNLTNIDLLMKTNMFKEVFKDFSFIYDFGVKKYADALKKQYDKNLAAVQKDAFKGMSLLQSESVMADLKKHMDSRLALLNSKDAVIEAKHFLIQNKQPDFSKYEKKLISLLNEKNIDRKYWALIYHDISEAKNRMFDGESTLENLYNMFFENFDESMKNMVENCVRNISENERQFMDIFGGYSFDNETWAKIKQLHDEWVNATPESYKAKMSEQIKYRSNGENAHFMDDMMAEWDKVMNTSGVSVSNSAIEELKSKFKGYKTKLSNGKSFDYGEHSDEIIKALGQVFSTKRENLPEFLKNVSSVEELDNLTTPEIEYLFTFVRRTINNLLRSNEDVDLNKLTFEDNMVNAFASALSGEDLDGLLERKLDFYNDQRTIDEKVDTLHFNILLDRPVNKSKKLEYNYLELEKSKEESNVPARVERFDRTNSIWQKLEGIKASNGMNCAEILQRLLEQFSKTFELYNDYNSDTDKYLHQTIDENGQITKTKKLSSDDYEMNYTAKLGNLLNYLKNPTAKESGLQDFGKFLISGFEYNANLGELRNALSKVAKDVEAEIQTKTKTKTTLDIAKLGPELMMLRTESELFGVNGYGRTALTGEGIEDYNEEDYNMNLHYYSKEIVRNKLELENLLPNNVYDSKQKDEYISKLRVIGLRLKAPFATARDKRMEQVNTLKKVKDDFIKLVGSKKTEKNTSYYDEANKLANDINFKILEIERAHGEKEITELVNSLTASCEAFDRFINNNSEAIGSDNLKKYKAILTRLSEGVSLTNKNLWDTEKIYKKDLNDNRVSYGVKDYSDMTAHLMERVGNGKVSKEAMERYLKLLETDEYKRLTPYVSCLERRTSFWKILTMSDSPCTELAQLYDREFKVIDEFFSKQGNKVTDYEKTLFLVHKKNALILGTTEGKDVTFVGKMYDDFSKEFYNKKAGNGKSINERMSMYVKKGPEYEKALSDLAIMNTRGEEPMDVYFNDDLLEKTLKKYIVRRKANTEILNKNKYYKDSCKEKVSGFVGQAKNITYEQEINRYISDHIMECDADEFEAKIPYYVAYVKHMCTYIRVTDNMTKISEQDRERENVEYEIESMQLAGMKRFAQINSELDYVRRLRYNNYSPVAFSHLSDKEKEKRNFTNPNSFKLYVKNDMNSSAMAGNAKYNEFLANYGTWHVFVTNMVNELNIAGIMFDKDVNKSVEWIVDLFKEAKISKKYNYEDARKVMYLICRNAQADESSIKTALKAYDDVNDEIKKLIDIKAVFANRSDVQAQMEDEIKCFEYSLMSENDQNKLVTDISNRNTYYTAMAVVSKSVNEAVKEMFSDESEENKQILRKEMEYYMSGYSIVTSKTGSFEAEKIREIVFEEFSKPYFKETLISRSGARKYGSVGSEEIADRQKAKGDISSVEFENVLRDKLSKKNYEKFKRLTEEQKKAFALAVTLPSYIRRNDGLISANFIESNGDTKEGEVATTIERIGGLLMGNSVAESIIFRPAMDRLLNIQGKLNEDIFQQTTAFVEFCMRKCMTYEKKNWDMLNNPTESVRYGKMKGMIPKNIPGSVDSVQTFKEKVTSLVEDSSLKKRVGNLDEVKLKRLVTVLQNRTILDEPTEKHANNAVVNEHMRKEVWMAITNVDKADSTNDMAGKAYSLERALTTLLSYQLRDDIEIPSGLLNEKVFADKALERETLIDEKLLKKALDFIDKMPDVGKEEHVLAQYENIYKLEREKAPGDYRRAGFLLGEYVRKNGNKQHMEFEIFSSENRAYYDKMRNGITLNLERMENEWKKVKEECQKQHDEVLKNEENYGFEELKNRMKELNEQSNN